MVWKSKVIKTDPTQILLACIVGYITDVDHLTFPLPLSETLPAHTNPLSGFVMVLLQRYPRRLFRSLGSKTTKLCFMLCFCTIPFFTPCSLCVLRGDNWEEKLQSSWNTAITICLLCLVYCKWILLQVIAGLSELWFVLSLGMISAHRGDTAWLTELGPLKNIYWYTP